MPARSRLVAATAALLAAALAGCVGTTPPVGTASAPATAQPASPSPSQALGHGLTDQPMNAADATAIDQAMTERWQAAAPNAPALYVGIWDPKRGYFTKAYGETRPGTAATLDDFFRIGSITKSFTATVVLRLVDQGTVTLTDTIRKAAPKVAAAYPSVADRTVGQLLGMRSGIPDYANNPKSVIVRTAAKEPSHVFTADELIKGGLRFGLKPAGKKTDYSTTNYILLQLMTEEITGKPLAQQIAEGVTGPLGMTSSTLPPDDDTTLPDPKSYSALTPSCQGEFKASGATVKLGTDLTDWSASYGQGGGGMTGTVRDLAIWAASGSGDELLAKQTVATRNTFTLMSGLEYGLGKLKIGDWVGHEGEAFGWETLAVNNPKSGAVAVFAINSCGVLLPILGMLDSAFPAGG